METPELGGGPQCQPWPSVAQPAETSGAAPFPSPLFHLSMLSHLGR